MSLDLDEDLVESWDVFREDDVGVYRCGECNRSVAELEERGHAESCPFLAWLKRMEPRGMRRRVVAEWPGLKQAIQSNHDLRANLLGAIVQAYRDDYARAAKRWSPWLTTRQGAGAAIVALKEGAEVTQAALRKLGDLEHAALLWWSSVERMENVGEAPRQHDRKAGRR